MVTNSWTPKKGNAYYVASDLLKNLFTDRRVAEGASRPITQKSRVRNPLRYGIFHTL